MLDSPPGGPGRRPAVTSLLLLAVLAFFACSESDGGGGEGNSQESTDDSTAVERGRYLAEGLLQCMICHSERDWEKPGAPPVEGRRGAGRVIREEGPYRLVAPNLTPHPETGIGRWTDEQLIRAIRRGVGHDGRALHPLMYYGKFRHLTDDDVEAVVAYLRSLEPIDNPLPSTHLSPEEREQAESGTPATVDPIDLASLDSLERGHALVTFGDCVGCHTAWSAPRNAPELAGGNLIERGERSAFSTNITPHLTGMPYDAETFIRIIRTGKGGATDPLMPWIAFRKLSDADLRDIHAYLQTRPPFTHQVSNHGEPTFCPVCGQEHGLGELNDEEPPRGIDLDPANYERYTGTYVRVEESDDILTVEAGTDGLTLRFGDSPPMDVVALSPERILVPGMLRAPLRFEFNGRRRATRVVYETVDPVVLVRRGSSPNGND